jgi:hypothetical protein
MAQAYAHYHAPPHLSKPLLLLIIFTLFLILIHIRIGVGEGRRGGRGYGRMESGNWKTNFESHEEAL